MAHRFTAGSDPTRVLGRRFVAFAIDLILLVAVAVTLLTIAKHTRYYDAPSYACSRLPNAGNVTCFRIGSHAYVWNRTDFLRVMIVTALAGFVNLAVLPTLVGASVGKLFVGLRVVDRNGVKADFLRNFGRWVLLAVDAGIFLIGLVSVIATHPHRRVGDFLAGTFVVATGSVGEPIVAGAEGAVATVSDSAASWPPAVTIPDAAIPTVPTPAPTSLWSPTDIEPPAAPSPQWTTPPVRTPAAPPPPPPAPASPPLPPPIDVSPPAAGETRAPAIPAPWATPPEPTRPSEPSAPAEARPTPAGADTPTFTRAPTEAAPSPPAPPAPEPAPTPPPAAPPETRPLESEPAAVRVPPPAADAKPAAKRPRPAAAASAAPKAPPKTARAPTARAAPPVEPGPATEPAPARSARAARPKAPRATAASPASVPTEPPATKPAQEPTPAQHRWTPVAPTAAPDAAPEAVADEWFELALSSDVPDDEPGEH